MLQMFAKQALYSLAMCSSTVLTKFEPFAILIDRLCYNQEHEHYIIIAR